MTTACKFIMPFKLFFTAVPNPAISSSPRDLTHLQSQGLQAGPQHECPDYCLLLSIHSSPAILLKRDEPFPPPTSHMHAWEQPLSLNVLSRSRSKHVFVAKRPSPSKQQKFRHSLDKSTQLKLINPLPLMYWEPEQKLCMLRWWGRISIIIC